MAPAAFIGNYANIVTRKTRSVCVVEVELPIEQMQAFIAAFGAPLPGKEVPVALARLDPSKPASEPLKGSGEAAKGRRPFKELPFTQQAAMRCNDPDFRRFIGETYMNGLREDDLEAGNTAIFIRDHCRVTSRSFIMEGMPAGDRWLALENAYKDWKYAVPLAEPTR